MFNNLERVIISINEYGINNIITIDNNKKDISLNGEYNNLNIDEFNSFIESFFRIIREWKNEGNEINNNFLLGIKIIEKSNQYDLFINENIPDNYDSFLNLIHKLK